SESNAGTSRSAVPPLKLPRRRRGRNSRRHMGRTPACVNPAALVTGYGENSTKRLLHDRLLRGDRLHRRARRHMQVKCTKCSQPIALTDQSACDRRPSDDSMMVEHRLFDNLVRPDPDAGRYGKPKSFDHHAIDDELVGCWLLHGKIPGPCALEDAIDEGDR